MGMQPVIAHADAETDPDPIKQGRNRERLPAEHEERGDRAYVKKPHDDRGRPIQPFFLGGSNQFCRFFVLHSLQTKVAGNGPVNCKNYVIPLSLEGPETVVP